MSPASAMPFFLVTDVAGFPLGVYRKRQQVGTKLRWVEYGRAFYWAPDTGLVEVTETFWWGCFNSGAMANLEVHTQHITGRIYRAYR